MLELQFAVKYYAQKKLGPIESLSEIIHRGSHFAFWKNEKKSLEKYALTKNSIIMF